MYNICDTLGHANVVYYMYDTFIINLNHFRYQLQVAFGLASRTDLASGQVIGVVSCIRVCYTFILFLTMVYYMELETRVNISFHLYI